MTDAGDAHDVGSLGEEAARLLGALSGWAREQAGDVGEGLGGLAAQAAASARDLDGHLATGSAQCTVCPVCRAVDAARQLSPEVTAHLSTAVTSLVQAAAAFMETADPRGAGDGAVEHTDVGDDWPEDE